MTHYFQDLYGEVTRPQVLLGLLLFTVGAVVLWHAWRDRNTPFPIGTFMPF